MTRAALLLLAALGVAALPDSVPAARTEPEFFYLAGSCEACSLDADHPAGAYWLVTDSIYEGAPDHFDAYVESYRRTLERWFGDPAPVARTVQVRHATTAAEARRTRSAERERMRARGYVVLEVPYHPSVE